MPRKYKQKAAFAEYGIFLIANRIANKYSSFFEALLRSGYAIRFIASKKYLRALYRGLALSEQSYPRTPSKSGGRIEIWIIFVVSVLPHWSHNPAMLFPNSEYAENQQWYSLGINKSDTFGRIWQNRKIPLPTIPPILPSVAFSFLQQNRLDWGWPKRINDKIFLNYKGESRKRQGRKPCFVVVMSDRTGGIKSPWVRHLKNVRNANHLCRIIISLVIL